jgi:alpha-amylase
MSESLFTTAPFLNNTNMYEVNVRQYTPEGTFNAFATHLPRLKDMGVEILWLMPIHPIGVVKRKGTLGSYYSISDFKAVNPEFGTASDFKNLVEKVHTLGMKIIIDWVANHAAWDNIWTKTNPDFFERDTEENFIAPYDWDDVIQINHKSEVEQDAMMDAMQHWVVDFDIDGFRADLAHLTPLQFWKNARTKLTSIKKDLIWLAETEEINYHEAFDISYTWKWMHTTEKFATGEKTFADCIKVLAEYYYGFPKTALRLFFTSNHDENSWNGTEYDKYGILAKAFAFFALMFNDVPLIYSGQELPNKKRLHFFDKDAIEWGQSVELHDFYKTLLTLRKRNNAFNKNAKIFFYEKFIAKNIMAYKLTNENDEVLVLINFNKENILEYLLLPHLNGIYKNIFDGEEIEITEKYLLGLDAGGYSVFEKVK